MALLRFRFARKAKARGGASWGAGAAACGAGGSAAAWLKKGWTLARDEGARQEKGDKAQGKGSAEGVVGLEQWLSGSDAARKHARVDKNKACVTATAQLVP